MRLPIVLATLLAVTAVAHAASEGRRATRTAKAAIAGGFGEREASIDKVPHGEFHLMRTGGPSRVVVLTPGARGYDTQRSYDLAGNLRGSFRLGAFSYSGDKGLLARERADGTWTIQSVRGGFSKATIVPDKGAMRQRLYDF